MQSGIIRSSALAMALSTLLAGCGSMKIWPFGEDEVKELPGQPPNSTAYECEGGKKFYVRMLDQGNTAWLILPLREVGLAKTESASGVRYSNGISTLHLKGEEAILEESPDNLYKSCKVVTAQSKAAQPKPEQPESGQSKADQPKADQSKPDQPKVDEQPESESK